METTADTGAPANTYCCPACSGTTWMTSVTAWRCLTCGTEYDSVHGIPKLYLEEQIGRRDRHLRDRFYDGFMGTYYQSAMPWLTLPVRPARTYWRGWLAWAAITAVLGFATWRVIWLAAGRASLGSPLTIVALAVLVTAGGFFLRHPYLFGVVILAAPVKVALSISRFEPGENFRKVHERLIRDLERQGRRLRVLDVSTGSCNSLYRHGWMKLHAEYTAVDLSETMLLQGQRFMAERGIPVNFVLADAARLPFPPESFDVVLSYGAVNGLTEPKQALDEMVRVARPGGLVLFLDEQIYESASWLERLYFRTVLSGHNVLHSCPVDLLPPELDKVVVNQIYHFYYLCTGFKREWATR